MLELITDPTHYSLHQICMPVHAIDMTVLQEMFALMRMYDGAGLAAPQVGINKRFFITCWGAVFVNPKVLLEGPIIDSVEGCLSIPGKNFRVSRSTRAVVAGKGYAGSEAIVVQHELDHLNGILISDRGVLVNAES